MHISACISCLNSLLPLVGFFLFFFSPVYVPQGHQWQLVNCGSELSNLNFRNTWLTLYFFFYIYILVTLRKIVRANCSPSCLEMALGLSTMDWQSPQGSQLPTARPWLCVCGGCREERRRARDWPRQSEAWPRSSAPQTLLSRTWLAAAVLFLCRGNKWD